MTEPTLCPECGARWQENHTCLDHFYQMGVWELDHQLYDVHHLMVLSYNLQHPSVYSMEGLKGALTLLHEFLNNSITPQAMRKKMAKRVDSGTRAYPITARPDSIGAYAHPVTWTMRAEDVIAAGLDAYYDSVRMWAQSVYDALKTSRNLP